jgi:hypothetical protein
MHRTFKLPIRLRLRVHPFLFSMVFRAQIDHHSSRAVDLDSFYKILIKTYNQAIEINPSVGLRSNKHFNSAVL